MSLFYPLSSTEFSQTRTIPKNVYKKIKNEDYFFHVSLFMLIILINVDCGESKDFETPTAVNKVTPTHDRKGCCAYSLQEYNYDGFVMNE